MHLFAALGQEELNFIAARTKAALAERKAQEVQLGGPRPGTEARNAAVQAGSKARALKIRPAVQAMRARGTTMQQIADYLTVPEPPRIRRVLASCPSRAHLGPAQHDNRRQLLNHHKNFTIQNDILR